MGKPLSNKKGFSYVLTCVCILVVMMLVSVAMQYAFIYHVAREQQNETRLKLDSYVTRYAVSKYDALKQGEPWDDYIDRDDLIDGAYTLLGFSDYSKEIVSVNEGAHMLRPTITAVCESSFGIRVEYELLIHIEMFNSDLYSIKVPITLVSQYKQK